MPKLDYSKITKGGAVGTLLYLYMQEPAFMAEWKAVREPYLPLIEKAALDLLSFPEKIGMSNKEYYEALMGYYAGKGPDPFPVDQFEYVPKLQPYMDSLGELAKKWKIRAYWNVFVLYLFDVFLCLGWVPGMESDVTFEQLESIFPWEPPRPPLELRIPAWAFIIMGREHILDQVAARLKAYEGELKGGGLKEYPSSVEGHARLWFEHYVHGKKYPDLEKEYSQANAESIKKAVWKFSKLVGIRTR